MAVNDYTQTKQCSKCKEVKDVANFGKQSIRKDGLNPWCKACKSISGKEYNKRHKDRLKPIRKAWREANSEAMKPYYANYYLLNKEKQHAASADWAKRHPEQRSVWSMRDYWKHKAKRLASAKVYRELNKESVYLTAKLWRDSNVAVCRALSRSYKARKRGAEGNHNGGDIELLYSLQKSKCICCKSSIANGYHVDHVMPLALGGSNWPHNLQLLCPKCNMCKSAKHPIDFMQEIGMLL